MRVKRPKPKDVMKLPDELFVQPQLLDQLANTQDRGAVYFGECVYPPWKRQRKSAKDEKKFKSQAGKLSVSAKHVKGSDVVKAPKKPFTLEEEKIILEERRKGRTWDLIARMLSGRTAAKVKKHYNLLVKNRVEPPKVVPVVARASKQVTPQVIPPPAAYGAAAATVVPLTKEEQETKLYNKIVVVPDKFDQKKRPQLFFVLNFNEVVLKCHLIPLREVGVFKGDGKTKWMLVPEGQGEELEDVPAGKCTIISSEAVNKVPDADKEAWHILDRRYE
ncbi:hypothetical protein HOP50_01g00750 [Chloropicon primus]|uniref:Myb-like domain-containing protein n=1 Tax=Chloropicon primus TaxID=1764295 RepID=A0A5B8MB24_9CHLO|nr:hypothetical protein A3770_01p00840 [Chloropicon primus]UPQ96784.1 hypothetical protein HOP50_01g00750 [Chloropicon primus]|eukprot:QDZ17566.1 hypothetical protein A3770_01p00840 [Chloropicon primus]